MKRISFLVTLLALSCQIFASAYGYFMPTVFFGATAYNRVVAGGKKEIKLGTAYGALVAFEYGLEKGLKMGAIVSFDNLALQTDLGSLYSTMLSAGISTSFAFDFPQIESVVRVSGGLLFVFLAPATNLGAIGLAGDGYFDGRIYFGFVEFAKQLTDQLSISLGSGVRFYDLYMTSKDVVAQSVIVPINLKFSYRF